LTVGLDMSYAHKTRGTNDHMHHIAEEFIVDYDNRSGIDFPSSVDLICPFCGRQVNYSIKWRSNVIDYNGMATYARCPACREHPNFILVGVQDRGDDSHKKGQLYVYPAPKVRYPIADIGDLAEFGEVFRRAYESAINVYNLKDWNATAIACRRLLEGMSKTQLPEAEQKLPLARQLQELPKHRDLSKPILLLADAIRKGGNLGAHFDLEREPNEETATLMIELLEYIIEYLFIIPKRVEKFHNEVDRLKP